MGGPGSNWPGLAGKQAIIYEPARLWGRRGVPRSGAVAYQLALRRPGTSPRMVAWRSMLRPRPNLA